MGDREKGLHGSPPPPENVDPPRCEVVLAEYVERLNAGDVLNIAEIKKDHPALAEDLIDQLRLFQGAFRAAAIPPAVSTLGDYTLRHQIGRGS